MGKMKNFQILLEYSFIIIIFINMINIILIVKYIKRDLII